MASAQGNYLEIKDSQQVDINYLVFSSINLSQAVCQISEITQLSMNNIEILNSFNNNENGIIYFENINEVNVQNLLAENNQSENGGAMYFENVINISILQSQFKNNQATVQGGGILIYGDSPIGTVQILETLFESNQAYEGGGMYVTQATNIIIQNSNYTQNHAENAGGGANFVTNNNIVIQNLMCTANTVVKSGGCLCGLKVQSINLQGAVSEGNSANFGSFFFAQYSGGIQMIGVNSTLESGQVGSLFFNSGTGPVVLRNLFIEKNQFQIEQLGGGLAVYSMNGVFIHDTVFDYCQAGQGGGASFDSLGYLYFENVQFTNNTSIAGGGALHMVAFQSVIIVQSNFTKNYGEFGGALNFFNQNPDKKMIIQNNEFVQNQALYSGGVTYYKNSIKNQQIIQSSQNYYFQNTAISGVLLIDNAQQVNINDEQFLSNILTQQGAVMMINNFEIFIEDNHFEGNFGAIGVALYLQQNNQLNLKRNTFINNQGKQSGDVFDDSSFSYIEENTFNSSRAIQANSGQQACILAQSTGLNSNFIVMNSVFVNNTAESISSAIELVNIYNVQINDIEIDSNINNGVTITQMRGGSILLVIDFLSGLKANPVLIIENITIHNNQGDSSGGVYIQGAKNCFGCLIKNITYENCQSNTYNEIQHIVMLIQSNYVKIDDVKFLSNKQNNGLTLLNSGDIILTKIYAEVFESQFNSIINIQASQNISLTDSQFYNITSIYQSTIRILNSADLILSNLILNNCKNLQGEAGGIYGTTLQNFQISNVQMQEIKSIKGSCIYIEQSNFIDIIDSQFTESAATISSPGFFFLDGRNYNVQNCLINNNVANSEVGGVTINKITNITFANSQINDNNGGQEVGGISVDNSEDVKFNNLTINNNFSAKQAGGLRFQYTINALIDDSHINNNKILSNKGGGIIIIQGDSIKFDNSEINENQSDYGGGIYIQQSKNITLNNIDVLKNEAKFSGGAIYISDTEDTYLNKLNIKNNKAISQDGGGIYIDQISEYVEIIESDIEENYSNKKGGGIFVGYLTNFVLNKVKINQNQADNQGSGLYLQQVGNVQISETIFDNNFGSTSGGAIYSINTQEIIIQRSNFKNNQASIQGGAIHVSEQQKLMIENTKMNGNKIQINKNSKTLLDDQKQSFGGSIYADQVVEFTFKNSNIKNSYSYFKGGGIYATNINNLQLSDSQIKQATVEAHIKYDIEKKDQEYLLSKGGGFYYEFNLEEDEIDSTDVKIKLNNIVMEQCVASQGGGMLIKQNQDQDFDYQISNLKFNKNEADIGPGARFLGIFSTNFQEKIKSVSKESNNKGYINDDALFFGFYRNEKILSEKDSEFVLCYQGQFSLEGGVTSCEPCIENGICKGGYVQIYPKEHYWRNNDDSLDFYYCSSYPEACLGNKCKETYDGVLCEDCDLSQNTFKEGLYCAKCDSNQAVVFNQILKMVILVVLTLSSVMSLKKKLDEHQIKKILKIFQIVITRENQFSIIMKIFITHNQILSAGSELAEKIPEKILNYMNFVGNPVDSVSKSLECLYEYENESDQYEILYKGQILGYALSIISLLILIAVPLLGFLFKKFSKYQLKPLIISTMLCYFITIQPGALQISLKSLYCRNIGGTLYSAFQSQVLCDSEFFMLKLVPLHITMIFILVVIIPLIILRKIHKYYCQGTLYHKMQILRSYGLFYIELSENKYYWEFIWMYMKILVVVIANFYPSQGTDQIALTLSLGVCIIQEDIQSWFVVVAFIIIFIGNCIFLYQLIILAFGFQIEQNIHLLLKLPIPCIRDRIQRRFDLETFPQEQQQDIKKEAFKQILAISKSQSYNEDINIQRNCIKEKVQLKKNILNNFSKEKFVQFNSEHAPKKSILGREKQFIDQMKQIKCVNLLIKNLDQYEAIQTATTLNYISSQSYQDVKQSAKSQILRERVSKIRTKKNKNSLFNLQQKQLSFNNSLGDFESSRNLLPTQKIQVKSQNIYSCELNYNQSNKEQQSEENQKIQNDYLNFNSYETQYQNNDLDINSQNSQDKNKIDEKVSVENQTQNSQQDHIPSLNQIVEDLNQSQKQNTQTFFNNNNYELEQKQDISVNSKNSNFLQINNSKNSSVLSIDNKNFMDNSDIHSQNNNSKISNENSQFNNKNKDNLKNQETQPLQSQNLLISNSLEINNSNNIEKKTELDNLDTQQLDNSQNYIDQQKEYRQEYQQNEENNEQVILNEIQQFQTNEQQDQS
ncbi:Pectin lyase fold/virulence factor [Pseudocohnilembus persalinus]|uniref:Pectin lyase fold/virulence factor n=1 Tax=Pseudocohnilembus persalinus TaxID=266149 RepID=A0A0V0R8P7_PSEPJ|nr:Pectin lyase fold/virulence factor [Pseudocohnilembus persalinus]|eukprot:KRX10871.1 Pectin lyase fold/virulence factor [Pseudocohnilembus persalinus]